MSWATSINEILARTVSVAFGPVPRFSIPCSVSCYQVSAKTMARLIGIGVIVGIALMCVSAKEDLYSDKYDDIDITNILSNDRLRDQHRKCYMSLGPCPTADMKFYKGTSIRTVAYRVIFYDKFSPIIFLPSFFFL